MWFSIRKAKAKDALLVYSCLCLLLITLVTYYAEVKIETKLYEKGKYTHFHCLSLQSLNELCNSILCDHGKGVEERKNTQFH